MKSNNNSSRFPWNLSVICGINLVLVVFGTLLICLIWLGLFPELGSEWQAAPDVAVWAAAYYYPFGLSLIALVCIECLAVNLLGRRIKANLLQMQFQKEKIAQRENEYQTLVESAQDVIIRSDQNRRCLYVSPIIKEYTGISVEEYVGKDEAARLTAPFDAEMKRDWLKVFETRQKQTSEFEYMTPEQEKLYFQARIVPELNPDGEVSTALAVVRNVTENKAMQRQLAHYDRLSLAGEMAAGIAHEIRNPMTTIRGFMQLMAKKEELIPKHKMYTNIVIEEIDRIDYIIKEFLSLARDKAISLHKLDLNGVIEAIAPLIQADALMDSKSIQLELGEIAAILADENEIRQLILNLTRNGIEAMPPGGCLAIRTHQEAGEVVLMIKDQGGGIPLEVMERLGRPFFTTKESGTGLGLAICYSIATRNDASIDFESGDSGTTVYVRFTVKL